MTVVLLALVVVAFVITWLTIPGGRYELKNLTAGRWDSGRVSYPARLFRIGLVERVECRGEILGADPRRRRPAPSGMSTGGPICTRFDSASLSPTGAWPQRSPWSASASRRSCNRGQSLGRIHGRGRTRSRAALLVAADGFSKLLPHLACRPRRGVRSPPRGAVAVGIKRSIDTRGAIPGLRGAAAMATLKKRLDLFSDAGCLGDSHNRLGELLKGFQAESTALGRGLPSPGMARWRLAWGPTGTPPRVGPALSGGGVGVGSGSAPTRTVGGRRATPPAKPTNARRSELGQAAERATERAGRKPPSGLRAPPSTARKGGTIWESVYAEVQYPHRCRPADTGSLDTHCYRCAGCPRGAREGSCTACLLLSRLMPPW